MSESPWVRSYLTAEQNRYLDGLKHARSTKGRAVARIVCSDCGMVAAWIHDTSQGCLYVSELHGISEPWVKGQMRRLKTEKGERQRAVSDSEEILLDWPEANPNPNIDPQAVRAFCPKHKLLTTTVGDLTEAIAHYRATGRAAVVVAR